LVANQNIYPVVAIGCSAGGLSVLSYLLENLPADFLVPIIVVQHRAKNHDALLEQTLQQKCKLRVKQADEKETISQGYVYIAPPDYHLLVEQDESFSLSVEKENSYSRPSIDVLFETAAEIFGNRLTGIVLTGANHDGAAGITTIYACGGTTIAQDPTEAAHPMMPQSAIGTDNVQHIMKLEQILSYLIGLSHEYRDRRKGDHTVGG